MRLQYEKETEGVVETCKALNELQRLLGAGFRKDMVGRHVIKLTIRKIGRDGRKNQEQGADEYQR